MNLKDAWAKFLKSITPQMIVNASKALAAWLGLSFSYVWGIILAILVKIGAKKIDTSLEKAAQKIIDEENRRKYLEVINDPNSSLEDRKKAEMALLNGR